MPKGPSDGRIKDILERLERRLSKVRLESPKSGVPKKSDPRPRIGSKPFALPEIPSVDCRLDDLRAGISEKIRELSEGAAPEKLQKPKELSTPLVPVREKSSGALAWLVLAAILAGGAMLLIPRDRDSGLNDFEPREASRLESPMPAPAPKASKPRPPPASPAPKAAKPAPAPVSSAPKVSKPKLAPARPAPKAAKPAPAPVSAAPKVSKPKPAPARPAQKAAEPEPPPASAEPKAGKSPAAYPVKEPPPVPLKKADILSMPFPAKDPRGLALDGEAFVSVDASDGKAVILDPGGRWVLRRVPFPNASVAGLTAGEACFWSTDGPGGFLYKHDGESFAVLEKFPSPDGHPGAIHFDGGSLWTTDLKSAKLYWHGSASARDVLVSGSIDPDPPAGMVRVGEHIWVVGRSGNLRRYAIEGGLRLDGSASLAGLLPAGASVRGMSLRGDWLWVLASSPPDLYRIPAKRLSFR